MKTIRLISASILAAACAAAVALVAPDAPPTPLAVPEHAGAAERVAHDVLRMRDPATGSIPRGIRRRELAFASTVPSRDAQMMLKGSAGTAIDWQQRGPSNVGGRTRAFAVDVSDHDVLLAGGVTGGMWRSENRGQSWRRTTLPSQMPSVTCVAQDTRPGHTATWYYGTGEFRTNSDRFGNVIYAGDGIFKSTDGGASFAPLASTVSNAPELMDNPFDFVNRIVVDASNVAQEELYAACVGGIMRSTDGGESWTRTLGEFPSQAGFTDVAITPLGVVYASIGSAPGSDAAGIWRSVDGVTWSEITPQNWGVNIMRRSVLAIAPGDPETVYFFAETPGAGKQIQGTFGIEGLNLWRYRAGTWENRSSNIPSFGQAWDYTSLASYALHLTVHPTDPEIVLLGGANLYVSTNGFADETQVVWIGGYGKDWTYGVEGSLHPDQHAAVFDPDDHDALYAANDGGVYWTAKWDAATPVWEQRNTGYITTQFYSVAIDHDTPGSQVIAAGAQDNGTYYTRVADLATPWAWVTGGDGSFAQFAEGGRVRYTAWQGNGLARDELDENGAILDRTFPGQSISGQLLFINPYTLDRTDRSVLYYAAGRQIARNAENNSGTRSWQMLTGTYYSTGGLISAVASSAANPSHRLWYGTADGRAWILDSANAGSPKPRAINGSNWPTNAYINCIAVDPHDGNRAVVVFSNYNVQSLYLTTDGGASWTPIGGNLEENPNGTGSGPSCRWATFLHTPSETMLFVGTSTGLYSASTLDGMNTAWRQEGAATIGNVIVDMIDARESDGFVAIATWGNGIFSANAAPGAGAGVRETAARATLLGAPRPNPARGSTTVSVVVPTALAASNARISVIDVTGRELAVPHDARLGAGAHDVDVHLDGIAPGSYYLRVAIGGLVESRPLVVR